MKRIYYYIMLFCCCVGCTQDHVGNQSLDTNKVILNLLTAVNDETRVPGADALNENLVEKVNVFFYDEKGEKCVFYPSESEIQYNSEASSVEITIPQDKVVDVLGHVLTIYVVANSKQAFDPEGKTLKQLQETEYSNSETFNSNPFTAQSSFLMDGKLEKVSISSSGASTLPTLLLQRAAAKIDVKINNAQVNGYVAKSAKVRLSNYLDKTTLGSDADYYKADKVEYKSSEYRPISLPGLPVSDEGPFYSYENDWEFDAVVESYIVIAVYWEKEGGTDGRNYYYRIPFNYIPENLEDDRKFRLRRNFIYELDVDLSVLGGNNPEESIELNPTFTVKDWTSKEIDIEVNPYDYLIVEERDVAMHNITHYEIPYVSSKRVSIQMDSVFYRFYGKKGVVTRVDRQPGQDYYPTVVANHDTNMITIDCMVPINYVPTYIYFTVVALSNLKQQVKIMLYPRQYITAEWSPGPQGADFGTNHPKEDPLQNNYNFYIITTTSLAQGDPFVLGDPTTRINNDPTFDHYVRLTNHDEVSNKIISPQFLIASQRGITQGDLNQTSAKDRCATYFETPSKYPKGMWRVPTEAELTLIARLQRNPDSALKDLFYSWKVNDYWWTARYDLYPGQTTKEYVYSVKVGVHESDPNPDQILIRENFGHNKLHAVRCVYDLWRPYEKNIK